MATDSFCRFLLFSLLPLLSPSLSFFRANLTVLFRGKMTPRSAGDDGEKWQVGRYHRWKRGLPITAWALRDFTASILPRPVYEVREMPTSRSQRSSESSGISLAAVKVIAIRDRSRITRVARYTNCVNARKFVSVSFVFADR